MISQAIHVYETYGVVVGWNEISHANELRLNYPQTEKFYIKMGDKAFEELINLIHNHDYSWSMIDEQRRWEEGFANEKRIKELLRGFLWEDVEPFIKDEWRKEAVKSLF